MRKKERKAKHRQGQNPLHLLNKPHSPGQNQGTREPITEGKNPQQNSHPIPNLFSDNQALNHLKNQEKGREGPAHDLKEEKTNRKKT
jgi:hypothetical protein